MPHSFATTANLDCPHCHKPFSSDVWLIVDVDERPELAERIRAGTLHEIACPHCAKPSSVNAPLLVLRATQKPALIFIPADGAASQQNQQTVDQLLGMLRQNMGRAWQEAWIDESDTLQWDSAEPATAEQPQNASNARTPSLSPSLQTILQELSQPARIAAMPRRVQLCEAALTQIDRAQNPPLWAWLQAKLGNSLTQNPQGPRAENLERAIAAYEQALQVQTRQAMPVEWATTTMNLGNAYYFRVRGERAENQERAIAAYEQALQVRTRQAMTVEWAEITMNLASAYYSRIRGERAENQERAITAYEQALQVRTQQEMPVEWALTTMNLASAYYSRIRGERAENLERAIAAYEQALQVVTRQAMPAEWAQITMNLATAYSDRIRGERAENLERAIAAYEQALQVRTQQAMPVEWAQTTLNLAAAYLDRIRGKRAENLERSIALNEQALQVMTWQAMPIEWATTTMNLASAYYFRIRGERAENLERSIALNEQALQVRTRQAMPVEWATTTMNLASAYSVRIRGERSENLERSIALYEQALQVMKQQAMPIEWATATMNLANAYSVRIRGERAENQERAIAAYKQALQVQTRQVLPVDWAKLTINLATAYSDRIRGERAENLERSIALYEQALQVMTRQAMPVEWAQTTMNLATAYRSRIRGKRTKNLERAIGLYQQALAVQRIEVSPVDHRRTQRNLADLYFSSQRWSESVVALRGALAASELLYQLAATPEARQAELAEIRDLPTRLAYAQAKQSQESLADLSGAVLILEKNRARWLSETLALRSAQPAGVPATLWQGFIDLAQQIQTLQAESRLPEETPAKRPYLVLTELLRKANAQLSEIVTQIRALAPDFMPQPSFAEIQAAAQESPLLYLLTTSAGGLALIVSAAQITPVWLDGFSDETLNERLREWFAAYSRQRTDMQGWLDTLDRISHQLWDEVMGPVAEALHALFATSPTLQAKQEKVITLIPTGLLGLLPLHAAWMPHPNPPQGEGTVTGGNRRYFLDEFAVRYAPSARVLNHSQARLASVGASALLAVDEPQPVRANRLPNSAAEVAALADHFVEPVLLRHGAATRMATLEKLPQAEVAHFSCHGSNNWRNPLASGLLLAHNEMLTVRDLLEQQLPGARLASLSACETGIVGTTLPDEVVMLPSAMLQAGFAGVVASLWSVADVSTAMLMMRFYDLWRKEGLEPAQALRQAQQWVRDTTNREKALYFRREITPSSAPRMAAEVAHDFFEQVRDRRPDARDFEHPFWWSAFTLTGM